MKVTLKNRNIYLSPTLVREAGIKKGDNIFVFSVKGESTFGLHKATPDMSKSIMTYPVRSTPTGAMYITPYAPPVDLIRAQMRLSYRHRITLNVKKLEINDLPLFIFKK